MKIILNWLKSHNYVFLALYLPLYLILYFILEGAITTDYWVSWCPLDGLIPFCSPFVIFYVLWFPLIFMTGLYVLIFDPETFRRYMWFLAAGFSTSLLVCALFPNGQDMRPALEGANMFERLVMSLYANDTNTNVLPSMHVVAAINVVFAFFFSDKLRKPGLCVFAVAMCVLISASTVLIKQHSILDIFAAVILCTALWPVIYRRRKG